MCFAYRVVSCPKTYTCPRCRKSVKYRPTEVFHRKEIVAESLGKNNLDSEPRDETDDLGCSLNRFSPELSNF